MSTKPSKFLKLLHIPHLKKLSPAGAGDQFRLTRLVALMSDGSMDYHVGTGTPITRYPFTVTNATDLYKADRAEDLGLKVVKPAPIYRPDPRITYLSPKELDRAIRGLWAAVTWETDRTGGYFVIPKAAVPSTKWLSDDGRAVKLRSSDDYGWRISLRWCPDQCLYLDSLLGRHGYLYPVKISQIRRALKPWPDLLEFFNHLCAVAAAKANQRRNAQLAKEEGRVMKERAELARYFQVEDQLAAFEKRRR